MVANVQVSENSHGSLLWMFPPSYRSQKDFGSFVGRAVCNSGYLPSSVVEQELFWICACSLKQSTACAAGWDGDRHGPHSQKHNWLQHPEPKVQISCSNNFMQPLYRNPEESLKKLACLLQRVTYLLVFGLQKGHPTGSSAWIRILCIGIKRKAIRSQPAPSRSTTAKMLKSS